MKPFIRMVLVAVLVLSAEAWAQSSIPREETWVTDGMVETIVTTPTTVYIGGRFTYVGPCTGSGVPLDATTGQPTAVFPKVDGTMDSCVPDGFGGWYVGGDFTRIGGLARNSIAHILANGTVDAQWNPSAAGNDGGFATTHVQALAVLGPTVYAAGNFTSIGGQTRMRIAALDATTGLATAWNPNASYNVYALAVLGTTVYAGGIFTSIGGQTRNCIAALDATTGLATTWNPNANGEINALVASGTIVYAGGAFTSIGGQTRHNIAALDPATGLATAWDPNTGGSAPHVWALALSDTTVYAGGAFASIGGQTRNNIAALEVSTGLATAWSPNADGNVWALAASGATVYAGGGFTSIGDQTRYRIAALDATTGLATNWDPNVGGDVQALAVSGTAVYAGGRFRSIGGLARNNIAALDAATGLATNWNANSNDTVDVLTVSGTTLYVGGLFSSIGGQMRNSIAALDVTTGLATNWAPSAEGGSQVRAFAVSDTVVYVGGHFSSIGGLARSSIAALDATTGLATAFNPSAWGGDFGPFVRSLAVSGTTVYAGGEFTYIGGQPRNCIAALDATTGLATTWDAQLEGNNGHSTTHISKLSVVGTTVYVGGNFLSIGGQMRNHIGAVDASTGEATAWNPSPDNAVAALAVSGMTIYVGGEFTSIGGQTRNSIAALNTSTGLATDWNPNLAGGRYGAYVDELALWGTTVFAGGDFTSAGGQFRSYCAEFPGNGFVFTDLPTGGAFHTGDGLSMHVGFTGNVGHTNIQWTKDGDDIPDATTDTFQIPSLVVEDAGDYVATVTDESKDLYTTPTATVTVTDTSQLPALGRTGLLLLAALTLILGAARLTRLKRAGDLTCRHKATKT